MMDLLREVRWWLTGWWYSERRRGYHPSSFGGPQPLRCALVSLVLGRKVRSGASWHTDGTDYWWQCDRCGWGDSSL